MTATTSTNLFKLTGDQQAFLELFEEAGEEMTGEQSDAFDALWAGLKDDVAGCVERMLNFRAYLQSRASVSQSRKEAFAKAQKRDENAAERIEDLLYQQGTANGWLTCTEGKAKGQKIETDSWVVSVQKNGGKQPLKVDPVDLADVHANFKKEVLDPEAVRTFLEAGGTLSWARLEERGVSLRVK